MLFMGFLPISRLFTVSDSFVKKYWEMIGNVGTLEIPFVFLNLDVPIGSKILDIGCATSSLSLSLASFGYKVTGIDFRDVGYSHPNFTYHQKNLFDVTLDKNSFDCVLAVSFLENVGMGHYGEGKVEGAEEKTMEIIKKTLKPGGSLFIVVPGGRSKIHEKDGIQYIRIYEPQQIENLCKDFSIEKELFFKKENQYWIPTSRDEVSQIEYVDEDVGAILIIARKK